MTNNLFGNLTTEGLEQSRDVLGGSYILETDVYDAIIKLAYAGKSTSSQAQSVNLILDINGKDYRETVWVTNKNNENYSVKDGKKIPQIGFTTIDDLCLCATGLPLNSQTVEEKVVKLYDFEAKQELPKNVQVITSILGKAVKVAIQKSKVDKTKKNDATGNYDPTGEFRDENTIEKVFHPTQLVTISEARNKKPAEFLEKWVAKNKGVTRDKTAKDAGNAGRPGANKAAGAGAGAAKANNLFN